MVVLACEVAAGVSMRPPFTVPNSLGAMVEGVMVASSSPDGVVVSSSVSFRTTSLYSRFVGIRVACMMPDIPSKAGWWRWVTLKVALGLVLVFTKLSADQ